MALEVLREDALRSRHGGAEVLLSLPWIRSLPLWSLDGLELTVDGAPAAEPRVALGERTLDPAELVAEPGWWFIQDRLRVVVARELAPGAHGVAVSFRLRVPYLAAGPDAPLALPFRAERMLVLDAPRGADVSEEVA